eukprot:c27257_g1_i2 orf=281-2386(+)
MNSETQALIPVVDGDLENFYYVDEAEEAPLRWKKVSTGDVFEAARAGDVERLKVLLEQGVNVNMRDPWDSVALYYACLAGHLDAARMLLESGAICSENTFDGDRCHYAALNLRVRKLLKAFEARPPPLEPLPKSLREIFLSSKMNSRYLEGKMDGGPEQLGNSILENTETQAGFMKRVDGNGFKPDITFYVGGRPIEAHRVILIARSPFFKKKFDGEWRYRKEISFSSRKLSYPALFSLIHFFYTDRLDVAVDDMEDLVKICKVCGCFGLKRAIEKELIHQTYAEYKHLRDVDGSQKRFILQGSSLLEEERLPAALHRLLVLCLERSKEHFGMNEIKEGPEEIQVSERTAKYDSNSCKCPNSEDAEYQLCDSMEIKSETVELGSKTEQNANCGMDKAWQKAETQNPFSKGQSCGMEGLPGKVKSIQPSKATIDATSDICPDRDFEDDHADVCFLVEDRYFRIHQVISAARSEYFRTRFYLMKELQESSYITIETKKVGIPVLEERDVSAEAFKKLLEYMYTDQVLEVGPDLVEEMFDSASRYLLFPLKRAVADALLPELEMAPPAELCHWLLLADMYGVWKLREHCLDAMAANFELFAATRDFRKMLRALPPPSGDSSQRTSIPSAPGGEGKMDQGNLLDDLREKWLEAEGAELDKRDESACQFDQRLKQLVLYDESDEFENNKSFSSTVDHDGENFTIVE